MARKNAPSSNSEPVIRKQYSPREFAPRALGSITGVMHDDCGCRTGRPLPKARVHDWPTPPPGAAMVHATMSPPRSRGERPAGAVWAKGRGERATTSFRTSLSRASLTATAHTKSPGKMLTRRIGLTSLRAALRARVRCACRGPLSPHGTRAVRRSRTFALRTRWRRETPSLARP